MNVHRIETTINQDGTLTLKDIPFQAGDEVEVIILERPPKTSEGNPYPLRGQPVQYDAPTEPVEDVKQLRPFALCEGEFVVPEDFDAPLPEEILSQFEGR